MAMLRAFLIATALALSLSDAACAEPIIIDHVTLIDGTERAPAPTWRWSWTVGISRSWGLAVCQQHVSMMS